MKEMDLICRRMVEDDLPQVLRLGNATENFEVGEGSGFWDESILRRWLTTSDDPLLVSEKNGDVLGFILGAIHHPTQKATLENIVVKPEARRTGVARQLLSEFMSEIDRQGVLYVCALSKTTNDPAINFFLKNGFERGHDFAWIFRNKYP